MRALGRQLASRLEPLWHLPRADCRSTIQLRSPAVPASLILFLAWLALRPNPYALTGAVFCAALLLLTYAWARSMGKHVTTGRKLRFTAVQVGDRLEETVKLENRSPLPVIFAEFADRSSMPGYAIDGVRAVGSWASVRWTTHTTCTQRGIFPLGRWETRLGDPFGLFEVRLAYQEPTEITVYPPLARIPPLFGPQRRTMGDRLSLRQAITADTVNAISTHPYVHGEPLRRIHWRTSARTGQLHVKNFEPEASSVVWLILDLEAAAHVGEGPDSSMEKLVILAASLTAQLLDQRLAVGMLLGNQVVTPRAGRWQLWSILRSLAGAQPESLSLSELLRRAADVVSLRQSAIVLTPTLRGDWVVPLRSLEGGTPGGPGVVLLDPSSFGDHGSSAPLAQRLRSLGVPTHVLRSEAIQPIVGSYGPLRRWAFRTLGTGRVVARQTPREAAGD